MVEQYLELSKKILGSEESRFKSNKRRGLGRIYLFGEQNKYDLSEGFPLLTTKRMGIKTIAHELIWFLRGETNIKYLADNNVHIWDDDAFNWNLEGMVEEDIFPEKFEKFSPEWYEAKEEYVQRVKEDEEFSERWGDLGPVYGSQWIHWPAYHSTGEKDDKGREIFIKDPNGIDQIATTIKNMKRSPKSARHIVSAWNPEEVPQMALPPCHTMFQVNSDGESLDLQLYQRACDMFLGVPFNIASYSMLTHILANEVDLKPGKFIHTFGDVHFYAGAKERSDWYEEHFEDLRYFVGTEAEEFDGAEQRAYFRNLLNSMENQLPPEPAGTEGMDHVTGILEQLTREPKSLPKISIADKSYNELTIDDFVLEDYEHHPPIRRALAV